MTTALKELCVTAVVAAAVAAYACGGGGSGAAPSPTITCATIPNPATTFLILSNAVCPSSLTVPRGTRVTFFNNDSRVHEINSNPHPEHTDCPEINQVGHIESGQQRDSGNLNIARSCGFHDHLNPENRAMQGTIIVQ